MSSPSNIDESGAAVEPDLSGRTLGDYQLIRQLGAGGMSNVYLAEQLSLRRKVALKVLKRRLSQDASYVRRFHREAQAAAKLVHANIVQIYEVGDRDGYHYIAQEYVPGRNLKQVLDRDGVVKARPAVSIMRRVLAALKKAGEEGITHRDIKPENIMIAPNGDVKVADFGLARIDEEKGVDLTQIGVTMGTPLYMSPEQVEGRHVDRRSDLYSLGVSCYHMLAGRPPFQGDTPLSIAVQHLKDAPSAWSRYGRICPRVSAASCIECWRRTPRRGTPRRPRPSRRYGPSRSKAAPTSGPTWTWTARIWEPASLRRYRRLEWRAPSAWRH